MLSFFHQHKLEGYSIRFRRCLYPSYFNVSIEFIFHSISWHYQHAKLSFSHAKLWNVTAVVHVIFLRLHCRRENFNHRFEENSLRLNLYFRGSNAPFEINYYFIWSILKRANQSKYGLIKVKIDALLRTLRKLILLQVSAFNRCLL